MTDTWPRHPNGRNKKMGEMTREEQDRETRKALGRLQQEFDDPLVKEKIIAVLNGQPVNH